MAPYHASPRRERAREDPFHALPFTGSCSRRATVPSREGGDTRARSSVPRSLCRTSVPLHVLLILRESGSAPDIGRSAVCQGLLAARSPQAVVAPHDRVITRPHSRLHAGTPSVPLMQSPWLRQTHDACLLGRETALMRSHARLIHRTHDVAFLESVRTTSATHRLGDACLPPSSFASRAACCTSVQMGHPHTCASTLTTLSDVRATCSRCPGHARQTCPSRKCMQF
jgi:hypothetical protein